MCAPHPTLAPGRNLLGKQIEALHREGNADELRQLKAEIHKVLLKVVRGKRMIDLADTLMHARRGT